MGTATYNEVPLCARANPKKGSYTLEAAVVIPLVALFFAFILFWFRVIEVETEVYEALTYASRQTAASGVLEEKEGALLALAEGYFLSKLSKADHAGDYLSSAEQMLMLAESDTTGDYVDLVADYRLRLPISFFTVKDIHVRQESRSRKWTGNSSAASDDVYVYITETGTVYHLTKDCRYLDLSIQMASMTELDEIRNKSGHKYSACERCAEESSVFATIYVTDYGDAYHVSLSCSGLKRTVMVVNKNEVGDKKLCSKCEKNSG